MKAFSNNVTDFFFICAPVTPSNVEFEILFGLLSDIRLGGLSRRWPCPGSFLVEPLLKTTDYGFSQIGIG